MAKKHKKVGKPGENGKPQVKDSARQIHKLQVELLRLQKHILAVNQRILALTADGERN
jgi:hypothetical protein